MMGICRSICGALAASVLGRQGRRTKTSESSCSRCPRRDGERAAEQRVVVGERAEPERSSTAASGAGASGAEAAAGGVAAAGLGSASTGARQRVCAGQRGGEAAGTGALLERAPPRDARSRAGDLRAELVRDHRARAGACGAGEREAARARAEHDAVVAPRRRHIRHEPVLVRDQRLEHALAERVLGGLQLVRRVREPARPEDDGQVAGGRTGRVHPVFVGAAREGGEQVKHLEQQVLVRARRRVDEALVRRDHLLLRVSGADRGP
jgi:hypothetical protein